MDLTIRHPRFKIHDWAGSRSKIPALPAVSVTIITLNEADHIAAAIDSATWADEVIVVDCGSTDATVTIARGKGRAGGASRLDRLD